MSVDPVAIEWLELNDYDRNIWFAIRATRRTFGGVECLVFDLLANGDYLSGTVPLDCIPDSACEAISYHGPHTGHLEHVFAAAKRHTEPKTEGEAAALQRFLSVYWEHAKRTLGDSVASQEPGSVRAWVAEAFTEGWKARGKQ